MRRFPQRLGRCPRRSGVLALLTATMVAVLWLGACSKPDTAQQAAPVGPSGSSMAAAQPSGATSAGTDAAASALLVDGPPTASGSAGAAVVVPRATGSAPAGTAKPGGSSGANALAPTEPTATPATSGALAPLEPTAVAIEPAAPGSADELAGQVDEIYLPIQRFRARFEQSYQAKVAGVTKKSTGLLVVERPGKLSFRYDPPNNNRVVSDGTTLRVYEADNNQLVEQPVARTEYPGALAFLMGHGLRPSFTFTFNDKAKFEGGRVLVGKPRSANPAYEQVLFYVDQAMLAKRSPGTIRRVVVLDAQKNRNRFDFLEASTPDRVEPSEFVFSPPPGVTVVK